MDCSPPGSFVYGIFQARILERVAISFSRVSSWLRDWICVSCICRWILYCWATWEACVAHLLTCYFNQHFLNTSYVLGVIVILSLSHVRLFVTSWTAARQAPLSSTTSRSLLKLMSIELVMPSNHLILCCPLLPLPSIRPSIRVFFNELALHIRWPKYWSFSFRTLWWFDGLSSTLLFLISWYFSGVFCQLYCCSVAKSCPTLCNPMNCSMPGVPILHYLQEFMQTHVHWVGDAIHPSHPLSSPSPPAFNLPES